MRCDNIALAVTAHVNVTDSSHQAGIDGVNTVSGSIISALGLDEIVMILQKLHKW